jgi:hypothetical protein
MAVGKMKNYRTYQVKKAKQHRVKGEWKEYLIGGY